MKKSVVLLATLLLIASCAKSENGSDSKRIKDVRNQTQEVTETVTTIQDVEAENVRTEKMKILTSPDAKMGTKIAAAAAYFRSFNFDKKKIKESSFVEAIHDFTFELNSIYDGVNLKKMSPLKEGRTHRDEQSFYAIALTLHINHQYKNNLLSDEIADKSTSFYTIIKKALEKEGNGDRLQAHEEILVSGTNKDMMVNLLKARVDIMAALALKNLTDERDMTLGQRIKKLLFDVSGGRLGSIDLPETYVLANEPTKKQTIYYLNSAVKIKSFLNRQGIEKDLEKTLKSAFSKIELGEIRPTGNRVEEQNNDKAEADKQKVEIRSLIDLLIQ